MTKPRKFIGYVQRVIALLAHLEPPYSPCYHKPLPTSINGECTMDDVAQLIAQIDACISQPEEANNVERLEWIKGLLMQRLADKSRDRS